MESGPDSGSEAVGLIVVVRVVFVVVPEVLASGLATVEREVVVVAAVLVVEKIVAVVAVVAADAETPVALAVEDKDN